MTRHFGHDEQKRYLFAYQDGRCGSCGQRTDALCLDHDHATGLTRGLLCHVCNTSEGYCVEYDSELLAYLEHPPCEGFGWEFQDYLGYWALDTMAKEAWALEADGRWAGVSRADRLRAAAASMAKGLPS